MSIADLLDDWFESPQVKGALAVNGVIGTWAGPYEPGTAYVMAHHSIGDVGDGQLGSWGYPEGGMGAVSDGDPSVGRALRRARCGPTRGCPRLHRGGRPGRWAPSWRTARRCARPLVVTSLHPQDGVPGAHRRAATCPRTSCATSSAGSPRSGVVKINLALSELPSFTANPGHQQQEHHTGSVEMAPTMEFIERAFQDAREGRPSTAPFSDSGHPDDVGQDPVPRRHPFMSAVHPVRPPRLEPRAAHRGARGVRRPDHRPLRRRSRPGSPSRSCTATSSVRTSSSRSTG